MPANSTNISPPCGLPLVFMMQQIIGASHRHYGRKSIAKLISQVQRTVILEGKRQTPFLKASTLLPVFHHSNIPSFHHSNIPLFIIIPIIVSPAIQMTL
jgi:hypothetical protein